MQIPAAAEEYTTLDDYQKWAYTEGYPQDLLISKGIDGINQDYFHTIPGSAGYSSGRIVIGDSRCCQLGIWENRKGIDDYAVYAVWGGHYVPGTGTPALTEEVLDDIEQCFHEQIRTRGESTVFFFATVNDYDYLNDNNAGYISGAVDAAQRIASLSYAYEGNVYHPKVIVIGFDGGAQSFSALNRYVGSYNTMLHEAVKNSTLLKETESLFNSVPEITNRNTTYISDGLHYSDATLQMIAEYIKNME